jgi:hypothetical protein
MKRLKTVTNLAGGVWQESGNSQWTGRDTQIVSTGGVLRIACSGDDEDLDVFTFDNHSSMVCQTWASFSNSTPPRVIVAYIKELLKS